jgi:TonB-linked SusC/RagA family outer membrane protein
MSAALAFILSISYSSAQSTVTGRVTSADDNTGLPGATVQIKGTSQGTVTDMDGNYSLQAAAGDVLVYSYVGFMDKEVTVGNQSRIDVALELDVVSMDEVVVVGYGSVRKNDLTGSVSVIDQEQLKAVPTVNPIDALQGQVPGLQITNSSGAPGSSPVVRIRGVSTSGDPSPLYVVDGVLLNDISYLNSADIETINVLKDASATAIYGNRGANGVIIIKTKSGGNIEGSRVSISSSYGLQIQQNRIDLLDGRQYAEVLNVIDPGSFNNLDAVPNTDWQDLIFEPAPIQTHTVSISGSSETNQYYFSVGYFGQQGTIPESNFDRLTLKINERYTPKDYLSVGTNLTVSPFWRDNTRGDAPFNTYRAQPVIEPRDANGNYNEVPGVGNILADLEYTTDNVTRGNRIVGQVFAEGYFWDGFTVKSSLGVEYLNEENQVFTPVFFVSSAQQNEETNYSISQFSRISWVWENTLNFDKEFDVHRINGVVGYTMQETRNEGLSLIGRDLFRTGENFRYLDPSNIDPSGVSNGVRNANDFFNQISYLGRINYSYDNRYIATFTFRRDGSSKFLGDNRYGNFPAAAVGWNIINESFLTLPDIFSNLKARASWGIGGNDKINYLAAYSTIANNLNAVFGSDERVVFGQSDGSLGNPNLIWEEIEQLDIGLEFGFLEDQLTAEFDYYNRTTTGTLIGLQLPDFVGNGTSLVTFNAGEFRNQGLEFNISWRDQIGDFNYNLGFNGTTIDNETLQVSGVEGADELLSPIVGNSIVTRTAAGLPIGAFYGYIVDGVFQTEDEIANTPSLFGTRPGDLIFRDVNGDGVITGDDRTFIGSSIPDFTYGFNLGGEYKNFTLDLLFQGQLGNEIYNIKETIRPAQYNYEQHVYDFWRGPGTSTTEPRPTQGGNNFLPSTRFIQDGSFLRLRTITIGYNLPAEILDRANLSNARIYLRGNNVFTLTEYTGYNPEVADGNPLLNGISRGTFPVSSVYTVGIDLSF